MKETEYEPRGFTELECPLGRCKFRRKFQETDYTLDNESEAAAHRDAWFRADHAARHPERKIG